MKRLLFFSFFALITCIGILVPATKASADNEGKNKITPKLYKIDGPANIRQLPNGKKIGQMANNTFAWVTAEEGDWCRVIQGDFAGWTHKQNLIDFWNQK